MIKRNKHTQIYTQIWSGAKHIHCVQFQNIYAPSSTSFLQISAVYKCDATQYINK